VRLTISSEQSSRIAHCGLLQPTAENAGGNLAVLDGKIASAPHSSSTVFGCEESGGFIEAVDFAIALLPWHWEQPGILRLTMGEGKRTFDRRTQGIFVYSIGGRSRSTPVNYCSNRNIQASLGDILVDGIVGKTRE
jgi:hypothetical protein